MTLDSGVLIHHSAPGANFLQIHKGRARATSQKKPDTTPITATPSS